MKKYYRFTRRRVESARYITIGLVVAALGVLAYFYLAGGAVWCGVLAAVGALIAVLPQFVIYSRYGVEGDTLYYTSKGIPRKAPVSAAQAALLCVHDEYRGMKGYVPALSDRNYAEGAVPLPAVLLLRQVCAEELDLCETRTQAKIVHKGQVLFDALLDLDFLGDLMQSSFAGKVYVSERVYGMYRRVLDELVGKERLEVYDRIPAAFKTLQKQGNLPKNEG